MIAEFGSLKLGGSRTKWFGDTFKNFYTKYPYVTSIVFFHYSSDPSTTYKTVNWYIKDDQKVTKAIKNELKKWDPSIKQPDME